MKSLYTLWQELKKTIFNIGFCACVLITMFLFFTADIYTDTSGKSYSVLAVITSINRSIYQKDLNFAAVNIIRNVLNGYFLMFIPIIAAFPFIPNFCAERNSGMIRLSISRVGKMRYYVTKFISALLGGGLAILLGYLLFSILIVIIFPPLFSYTIPDRLSDVMNAKEVFPIIFKCFAGAFLYGMASAAPAFLMASFAKNRYIITCVPFIILYLYNTSLKKLTFDIVEMGSAGNDAILQASLSLRTDTAVWIVNYNNNVRNSLILNLVLVSISFILFVIIMNRRWDLGE